MTDNPKTTEGDDCCGGGIGDVPYLLCTDCPRGPSAPVVTKQDTIGDLRTWLAAYTGMMVTRRDAEKLIEFLKLQRWKEPA